MERHEISHEDLVIATPDVGGTKRANTYARQGVPSGDLPQATPPVPMWWLRCVSSVM